MKRNLPQIKKLRHYSLFLIGLLGLCQTGWAQATQTFLANGTFTVPLAITSVKVECLGAGGGGSNRGGAAGTMTGLSTGDAIAITVGTGGAADSNGGFSRATIGLNSITANAGSSVANSRTGSDYTESNTKYFSHNNRLNKLNNYIKMKILT